MMTICHHISILLKPRLRSLKQKGTKADSVEKVTVADLLPVLEHTDFKLDEQPYSSLFAIYQKEFLDVSVSTGLIHSDALALAGDGTPVVTSHRERKKRICKCKENGITDCKCDRLLFPRPIVISAGILPATVIIMAMIYTCLLIRKVTYRYFLIFAVLQNMIHMDSCTLFSG